MRNIYMHNFRGFSNTLVPLSQVNFLVGENSSGKSSFLNLVQILTNTEFWISPTFSFNSNHDLGGFNDIVSIWSADRSYFEVGIVDIEKNKNGIFTLSFNVLKLIDKAGHPQLCRYSRLKDEKFIQLLFASKRTKYKIVKYQNTFASEDEAKEEFFKLVSSNRHVNNGFSFMPKGITSSTPIPLTLSLLNNTTTERTFSFKEFSTELPSTPQATWIAPIRSKPKRIYDGLEQSFSPEGDHSPSLLRKMLRTTSKSSTFIQKLTEFGNTSGLFETIATHSFNKTKQAPFEILITFAEAKLNINNVGYGVSQVLPVIVEFLSKENRSFFTVQQPEVHLHPRAQAALGGLVYELAKEKNHAFVLETHSDYLIDRYRLSLSKKTEAPSSNIIFFYRTSDGNHLSVIRIKDDGKYSENQPSEFRDFFVKEEMQLLDL